LLNFEGLPEMYAMSYNLKYNKIKYLASCISVISCLVMTSCSEDDDLTGYEIKGVWAMETHLEADSRISRLIYDFKDDGQVEVLTIEIDHSSGDILGYRSRTIGNYATHDNKLSFYNLTVYTNNDTDAPFSDLENLIKQSDGGAYDVTYSIEERGKKLIFTHPPCGPFDNCIPTTTLVRAE
jgi:hypothetical protein